MCSTILAITIVKDGHQLMQRPRISNNNIAGTKKMNESIQGAPKDSRHLVEVGPRSICNYILNEKKGENCWWISCI